MYVCQYVVYSISCESVHDCTVKVYIITYTCMFGKKYGIYCTCYDVKHLNKNGLCYLLIHVLKAIKIYHSTKKKLLKT